MLNLPEMIRRLREGLNWYTMGHPDEAKELADEIERLQRTEAALQRIIRESDEHFAVAIARDAVRRKTP